MSGFLDVNVPHCTIGHYHSGLEGTSLVWHGDQVMSSAMQRNVSGCQTHTCTSAHLLAQRAIVDKRYDYIFTSQSSSFHSLDLSLTHVHANTRSCTHTLIGLSVALILQNDRKQDSCFKVELLRNHSFAT